MFIEIWPSWEQIIVLFPFSIKLIFVFLINSLVVDNLFFSLFFIFKFFKTCKNSPSWGVITIFVLLFDNIFLKLFFKASASKTTNFFFYFTTFKINFKFF